MSDEVELPSLIVKTDKSEFRLRCHAAAWSASTAAACKSLGGTREIIPDCCCSVPPGRTRPPRPCGPLSTSPMSRPSSF